MALVAELAQLKDGGDAADLTNVRRHTPCAACCPNGMRMKEQRMVEYSTEEVSTKLQEGFCG